MSNVSKSVQDCPREHLSFDEVLLLEPGLISLMCEGWRLANSGLTESEKDHYWYKIMKPKMYDMVGFNSELPELRSCYYYDMFYQFFNKLLA